MKTAKHSLFNSGLIVCLALILPVPFALGEFAGGEGTAEDPWLVETAEQLNAVRNHLGAHFLQIAGIDLDVAPYNTGTGWEPIGAVGAPFTGSYDGQGNTVFNLFIDRDDTDGVGLFGAAGEGSNLTGIRVQNANVTGRDQTGGLAGSLAGSVADCHVEGTVTGRDQVGGLVGGKSGSIGQSSADVTVEGGYGVGGLVGYQDHDSTIAQCHATGAVNGDSLVGGLVGKSFGSVILRSFSVGPVSGISDVGGLVGEVIGGTQVEDCFARGPVTGTERVGGLAGTKYNSQMYRCYSTGLITAEGSFVGGMIGDWWMGFVLSSYWDTETSGQTNSAGGGGNGGGGKGRTTAEMTHPHAANTYEGWDFDEVWAMDTDGSVNNGYPYLRMPESGPDPISYEEWAEAIPNPEQRGDNDAPAGDNIPNLLKYACGLDPMTVYLPADVMTIYVPENAEAPLFHVLGDLQGKESSSAPFAIVFYRSKTAAGVHVFAEHATDLVAGDWNTDGVMEEKIGEDDLRETWKATAPSGEVGCMRLQVERVE